MTSSRPHKVPSRYFEKRCRRSSILKREIGSICRRESGRSLNLLNPSTNMQFLPQFVLKPEITKSLLVWLSFLDQVGFVNTFLTSLKCIVLLLSTHLDSLYFCINFCFKNRFASSSHYTDVDFCRFFSIIA
jgi:hypothetical protein